MDERNEITAKMETYRSRITELATIVAATSDTTFGRIAIVEAKSEIRELQNRVERLSRRLNGIPEPGPIDEQLAAAEYAIGDRYDEE